MRRLAIFDCDGTLVDGQASVCMAMEDAFAASGRPAPPRNLIRRAVGLSLPQAMAQLLPKERDATHQELAERYRLAFRERRTAGDIDEPLFDGIVDVLRGLGDAGWTMAVATGKSDRGLAHCLAVHDIGSYFVSLQTADRHPSKPDPSMIDQCLADTGIAPENAVMIGDTTFDIVMAINAGVMPVGVSWGYHPPAELKAAGARRIAKDPQDLIRKVAAT